MKRIAFYLMAAAVLLTASCKDENVAVSSVTLNKTRLELTLNAKETLEATINPSDATNKTLEWNSAKPEIAEVSQTGEVTGISAGEAIITVVAHNGVKAICTVTVTVPSVAVEGVSLNKTEIELLVGETDELVATVTPEDADNKNVTWSSSNNNAVTVNAGVITVVGLSEEPVIITVTTQEGSETATCAVTITGVPVTGVEMQIATLAIAFGASQTLQATLLGVNNLPPTNTTVTWSSNASNIVSVNSVTGEITAAGIGTATITVTTEEGEFTDDCVVTVADPMDLYLELLCGTNSKIWTWDDLDNPYGLDDPNANEGGNWWQVGFTTLEGENAAMTFIAAGKAMNKKKSDCSEDAGTFEIELEENPDWHRSIGKLIINDSKILSGSGDLNEQIYDILELTDNRMVLGKLNEPDEDGNRSAWLWFFKAIDELPECGEIIPEGDLFPFDNSKLVVKLEEQDGRRDLRLEIYNIYGTTVDDPGLDFENFATNKSFSVKFTLNGITFVPGATGSYKATGGFWAQGWWPSGSSSTVDVTGDGEYWVTWTLSVSNAMVFVIDIENMWDDIENPENVTATIEILVN